MKIQRLLIVLTLVNLVLLISTLAQIRPAVAEGVPSVLRGRALEIVDERGRVRASLFPRWLTRVPKSASLEKLTRIPTALGVPHARRTPTA